MLKNENGVVFAVSPAGRYSINLVGFFLIAFILSWLGAAPMVLASWLGPDATEARHSLIANLAPLQILMFFGTLITALLTVTVNYGWRGLKDLIGSALRFRVSPIWYVLALGGPALITIVGSVVARSYDAALPPFVVTPAILAATL